MLLLPPILDPLGGPRVPLFDETAVRLEQLLLEPSADAQAREIAITLGEDGLLTGWAFLALGEVGAERPASISALGGQLVERLVEQLSGLSCEAEFRRDRDVGTGVGARLADGIPPACRPPPRAIAVCGVG